MQYYQFHQRSVESKEDFWREEAQKVKWSVFPEIILNDHAEDYHSWFPGGKINISRLVLEENISKGRGEQAAIIYDSPVTGKVEKISYNTLLDKVSKFAGGLKDLGLLKGDTVIIYMPMIPEAVIAMLACARLGVIHSVVFGGFAPSELAHRIEDAEPKAIITTSHGIEVSKKIDYLPLVTQAIDESPAKPEHIIFFDRNESGIKQTGVVDFVSLYNAESAECVEVESTHPLYVLYTSGTTSRPKGIVRDTGGYAVALNSSMEYFYDLEPGDTILTASDIGWVVGHSYIVYGPLIYGLTTVLFEGKPINTPDAGAFWRMVEEHKIKNIFTAPTAIRAIRKEDPKGELFKKYDTSSLKQMFLAGERCDTSTFYWLKELIKKPVTDHWWQTESGWPMLGICRGLEDIVNEPGSAGIPVYGYDVKVINDEGEEVHDGEEGFIVVKRPLPPGCMSTLWKNPVRFFKGYFEQFYGYYLTGDGGYKDKNGYFFVTGRVDDIINVSGHRLSTATMEEVVSSHPDVAECAVVGIADNLKGQVPLGLVVCKSGSTINEDDLELQLAALVRKEIGPIACYKNTIAVKKLPKTRSGKILRKTISQIADGASFTIPSTIDDPEIIDELVHDFARRSLGNAFV